MSTKRYGVLLFAWLVFSQHACGEIITFDAANDFSLTSNTATSVWSYRYSSDQARDGSYDLFVHVNPITDAFSTKPDVWNAADNGAPAYLGVNLTGALLSSPFTWNANEMVVHPNFGGLVVLSWLSPSTGTATVDFSFSDLLSNGDARWFVERNDSGDTLDSALLPGGGVTGIRQITTSVLAGDRLNFIIDSNGSNASDPIAISASVSLNATNVPEPSSFALFLCGSALAMRFVGRRR